jgi:HAD superfamily hydrolase (TIGR01509 family)
VLQAIAFDLDDTLTDWWTGIRIAAEAVRDPSILERARETWIERDDGALDRHHWRFQHEPETFMRAELTDTFLAALDPPLFADVAPTLEALNARTRLALLTNNPYGAEVLARHGLHTDVFECVVVADPQYRKPDPRAFTPLVEALALAPGEIGYVGDTPGADVNGAIAAGLHPIWIDRWNDDWTPPAGVIRIGSLTELLTLT